MIRFLIDRGANPNFFDWMPLHIAVATENITELKRIAGTKSNLQIKNESGDTPLHIAARSNANLEVIEFLIKHGGNVNAYGERGYTPLNCAAGKNTNLEVTKYLVEKGAVIDELGMQTTPLHSAAENNSNVKVLEYLVKHGANVRATSSQNLGNTPLHEAARSNPNVEVIRFLIEQGASINASAGLSYDTPLHLAVDHNPNPEVIKYLIKQGANVKVKNGHNSVPIVGNTSASDLRNNATLRQHVAGELSRVQVSLDGLMVDRPRRNLIRRNGGQHADRD